MTAGSATRGGAESGVDGGSAAGDVAIAVDGLTKRYGDRTVLDGVSLAVAPGELVALLGPNGAGKTTTVEIVEGYRRGDGGTVRVLGQDPWSGGPGLRARVGLMLQGGGIDPRAQPRETLVQYGRFHADPRDPDELIDLVGLGAVARTRYRRLSGGERQRLGLALALVGRPEVLILDEPTAGMDPEGRAATRAIVADLRAAGVAILLTSHDLGDVERMADRVCVLREGRIVAAGTPAELAAGVQPRLRFTAGSAVGWRCVGRSRPPARRGAAGRVDHRRTGRRPVRARRHRARRRGRRDAGRLVCGGGSPDRRASHGRRHARGGLSRPRRRDAQSGEGCPMSRPASVPAAARAQTIVELRLTARRGENVLVTVIIPAVVLVFFASVGVLPAPAGPPVDFLLPGSIALAVIATSLVNLGIATAYERHYGVLKRLGGSPLTRGGLLAAKIGAVLVVELVQVALLVAIAGLALGWHPAAGANAALFAGVVVLGTFTFAGLALLLAGTLRAEATLALANALFLVALLLGGIILPLDHLPGPLAALAAVLPAAALSDAVRAALGTGGDAVAPVAILFVWGCASVALAARTFRWE